eukprot:1740889-Rhodomonas_salina.1
MADAGSLAKIFAVARVQHLQLSKKDVYVPSLDEAYMVQSEMMKSHVDILGEVASCAYAVRFPVLTSVMPLPGGRVEGWGLQQSCDEEARDSRKAVLSVSAPGRAIPDADTIFAATRAFPRPSLQQVCPGFKGSR